MGWHLKRLTVLCSAEVKNAWSCNCMAPSCLYGGQNAAVPLPSHWILHPVVFPNHCFSVWPSYLCFCFLLWGFSVDRIFFFFQNYQSTCELPTFKFLAFFNFYLHYETLHIVFPYSSQNQIRTCINIVLFSSVQKALNWNSTQHCPCHWKYSHPSESSTAPTIVYIGYLKLSGFGGTIPLFLISWNTDIQVLWCMMPGLFINFICHVTVY